MFRPTTSEITGWLNFSIQYYLITYLHTNIKRFPLYNPYFSCVADNTLGRAKKYMEVSGRPGPAEFHSAPWSRSPDSYNLTWKVDSYPPLQEVRLLYRKLMVRKPIIISFDNNPKIHYIKSKLKIINTFILSNI